MISKIGLTSFVMKQAKSKLDAVDLNEFIDAVNDSTMQIVSDSKWDFCKYVSIDNVFGFKKNIDKITLANKQYLDSGFIARTEEELPVLTRWFKYPHDIELPESKKIVVIVYSKEQLEKEGGEDIAMGDADWGIVSIQAVDGDQPGLIPPITAMRNALGIDEGGNGEKLNREDYLKSVDFWDNHAIIK